MSVCVYVCMYIYMYVYMYVCIYVYIYMCIYIYKQEIPIQNILDPGGYDIYSSIQYAYVCVQYIYLLLMQ